jgi:Flp pilus assembly protein TadG
MLKIKRKSKRRQQGLSAVEFTLALPFLLMMVGIFADFGRMYIQYTTLTKAVQDGARWVKSGSTGVGSITDTEVKNMVVYGSKTADDKSVPLLTSFSTSNVSIDTSMTGFVTVSAKYAYQPIFSNIPYLTQNLNLTLTASSVMRD